MPARTRRKVVVSQRLSTGDRMIAEVYDGLMPEELAMLMVEQELTLAVADLSDDERDARRFLPGEKIQLEVVNGSFLMRGETWQP